MNTLLGMVLVLGIMILVHEWGHYIVARIFKVRVDVFSIGFGPRLFGFKRGATDWRVSALPLGGYVRMAGQDMSEVDSSDAAPTGAADEVMSKPRWQRALISFAGPAVNLVFPIFLLTGLFLTSGVPYDAYLDRSVVVAISTSDSNAAPQGLRNGDKVLSINGFQNPVWRQGEKILAESAPGTALQLEVENSGVRRDVQVLLKKGSAVDRALGYHPIPPVIGGVVPGGPADRAGLRDGDLVKVVNGQPISHWEEFVDYVRGSGGNPLKLDVERKGGLLHLSVSPKQGVTESSSGNFQIGIGPDPETSFRKVGLLEAATIASGKTRDLIQETVSVVGKLITGRVSAKQLLGPVAISRAAGDAVSKGPLAVISLMVLISVNLGVLNLLPIPILDGGHILLLSIEGIRRRDLSLAFKERFVQVGLVFLLLVFAFVMYNDVLRRLPIHS